MNEPRTPLPTLTEVVQVAAVAAPAPIPVRESDVFEARAPALSEAQLVERVLADVQRQVDLTFEYRLREALAPALARLADTVLLEARAELAGTLRDLVERAVALELARQRPTLR